MGVESRKFSGRKGLSMGGAGEGLTFDTAGRRLGQVVRPCFLTGTGVKEGSLSSHADPGHRAAPALRADCRSDPLPDAKSPRAAMLSQVREIHERSTARETAKRSPKPPPVAARLRIWPCHLTSVSKRPRWQLSSRFVGKLGKPVVRLRPPEELKTMVNLRIVSAGGPLSSRRAVL